MATTPFMMTVVIATTTVVLLKHLLPLAVSAFVTREIIVWTKTSCSIFHIWACSHRVHFHVVVSERHCCGGPRAAGMFSSSFLAKRHLQWILNRAKELWVEKETWELNNEAFKLRLNVSWHRKGEYNPRQAYSIVLPCHQSTRNSQFPLSNSGTPEALRMCRRLVTLQLKSIWLTLSCSLHEVFFVDEPDTMRILH